MVNYMILVVHRPGCIDGELNISSPTEQKALSGSNILGQRIKALAKHHSSCSKH